MARANGGVLSMMIFFFFLVATNLLVVCSGLPVRMALKGVGSTSPPERCNEHDQLGVSWYYTWQPVSNCTTTDAEFIPMLWSGYFMSSLPQIAASGAPALLTFNEPDNEGQSNMTVSEVISLWPQIEQAVPPSMRLSTPAVSGRGEAAQEWLKQFLVECTQCRIDFIALHYYGNCTREAFYQFLSGWATSSWGEYLPIWLTEFDCMTGSIEDNLQFAMDVLPQLGETFPSLERYAWFATRTDPGIVTDYDYYGSALINSTTNELTSVGAYYASIISG